MTQKQITITVILAFAGFLSFALINSSWTDNNNGNLYLSVVGTLCGLGSLKLIYDGYAKQ